MKLNEWVDKDGNKVSTYNQVNKTSSGSYKKRFEKLIKYHIDHCSSELESVTKKDIKDYDFHLGEHYNTGKIEFDRDIVASADKNTGTLTFSIFVGGKEVCRRQCRDYEEFVNELNDSYMYLTDKGTSDYDDLLVEWVDKDGKKVNINSSTQVTKTSTKNYPDQTDRYRRLLAQITSDGLCRVTVNLLDDRILAFTTHDGLPIKIIYKPYVPCYLVQIDGNDFNCDDYEVVLQLLLDIEVIKNTDLCESASFADDFKTYENLWD